MKDLICNQTTDADMDLLIFERFLNKESELETQHGNSQIGKWANIGRDRQQSVRQLHHSYFYLSYTYPKRH